MASHNSSLRSLPALLCTILIHYGSNAQLIPSPPPTRKVEGILGNSFLVEEAYNQEAGVVQHILTGLYGWNQLRGTDEESLGFAFTQEWPLFNQNHQLS